MKLQTLLDWSLPPTVAIIVIAGLFLYRPAIDAVTQYELRDIKEWRDSIPTISDDEPLSDRRDG